MEHGTTVKLPEANRKYKDTIFRWLFSDKENLLSLYNAVTGRNYTDADALDIVTLESAVYLGMKNDVAFLVDTRLYLCEHQSTYNPNMPLRGMMYFSKMYDRYIIEHFYNIYGSTLIKLPTPRYTVLYNGTSEQPAFMKLRLSDAFIHEDTSGDFEWTANMININSGKNDDLLNNCKPLQEYMLLIEAIRKNRSQGMEVEEAVDKAVTYCIDHDILSAFLTKHRAEVIDVCITEYDEQVFVTGIREEGIKEGREEGIKTGRKQGIKEGRKEGIDIGEKKMIFKYVSSGRISLSEGAEDAGMSIDELKEAMSKAGYKVPEMS